MKRTIIYFLLFFAFLVLKSQSKISIGFTPAFTFNLNNPTKESQLNKFKIVSNYPSFKAGTDLLFERNKLSVILGLNYQWNKYGWRYIFYKATNTSSVYNLDEVIMSTESFSIDLMSSLFITPFFHDKAQLYFDMGSGYSFIKHTQRYGHYKISVHNSSFTKILTYNQADVGSNTNSPFIMGGVSVQALIKKVGKIRYGIHYTYYLNVLPEMKVNLEINNEVFTSAFETKHCYFELFLTYYILNIEKRQGKDKFHIVKYR